jgi:predicted O-methyltransferase YrrM
MGERTQLLPADVNAYVLENTREPQVLAELRTATASVPHNIMQIGADQGQFMALLCRLVGARRCIEVGTYTGYSALAVALALPPDGRLITCDVNAEWAAIGQRYWRKAGVEERIDLRIRPAVETLDDLLAADEEAGFDFAFIDADKPRYLDYYERLLRLIRRGGLIAVDNTLALAGVPVIEQQTENAAAMRVFNETVRTDERVDLAMLTIGEGLTLLRVR